MVHIVNLPHRGRVGTPMGDSFNLGNPDIEKRVDTRPSQFFIGPIAQLDRATVS
jgi:hypothetical protein